MRAVTRQRGWGRLASAAGTLFFPDGVELPQLDWASRPVKGLLLVGGLSIVTAAVIFEIGVSLGMPSLPLWTRPVAEADALAGLLAGCCLVLEGSRDYLLGVAGIAVSWFLAVVLATFAGATLYITGFAQANMPPWRQHLAVALALSGMLAAFLLVATPWSPRRRVAQPGLVVIALVAPRLALVALYGRPAFNGTYMWLPVLNNDPFQVVASAVGYLGVPLAIASSIEWVAACTGIGSRVARPLAARPVWLRAVVVCVVTGWVLCGAAGWLPAWLGGRLGAWALVRGAHPDAWLLAVVLTVLAWWFVAHANGRLDLEEARSSSYVPAALLFYSSLVGGLFIFNTALRLLVAEAVPAALPGVLLCCCAFAVAVAWLWSARGRRWARTAVMTGAGCAAVLAAALGWPVNADPGRIRLPSFGLFQVGLTLDTAAVVAAVAASAGVICLGGWGVWVRLARSVNAANAGRAAAQLTVYEAVVLPFGCWMLVLAGAALLRMTGGLRLSAFTHPVLPDPVVFTVVALPAASFAAIRRKQRPEFADAALTTVLVLPVLALLPFAVPASLGPSGRFSVVAVAAPILYGITLGGPSLNHGPLAQRRRRLCWLAGTSAIVVPLLAYGAVFSGQGGSLTSLETTTGSPGAGLGTQLRLALLLPLFVTFISARLRPSARLLGGLPPSRWRDLQADAVALAVRDGDLDRVYLGKLRRHLGTVTPDMVARYAVDLARRRARPYLPGRRGKQAGSADRLQSAHSGTDPRNLQSALRSAALQVRRRNWMPAELAKARSLVAVPAGTADAGLPDAGTTDAGNRDARRYLGAVTAVRCALDIMGGAPARVDDLVTISRHEIEDAAEALINGPDHGETRERNLARARAGIGAQLTSLEPFTVYELPLRLASWAPALILDEPKGVRRGPNVPVQSVYRLLCAGLALTAVLGAVLYFIFSRMY